MRQVSIFMKVALQAVLGGFYFAIVRDTAVEGIGVAAMPKCQL
jgi:hypothetical protein